MKVIYYYQTEKKLFYVKIYHVNQCRSKEIKHFEHACYDTLQLITQAYLAGFEDCNWNN